MSYIRNIVNDWKYLFKKYQIVNCEKRLFFKQSHVEKKMKDVRMHWEPTQKLHYKLVKIWLFFNIYLPN